MDAFSLKFLVFSENGKVCFDCAGASGLGFRPLLLSLCASIFALLLLHRFCIDFGTPGTLDFGGFWRSFGGRRQRRHPLK